MGHTHTHTHSHAHTRAEQRRVRWDELESAGVQPREHRKETSEKALRKDTKKKAEKKKGRWRVKPEKKNSKDSENTHTCMYIVQRQRNLQMVCMDGR